MPTRAKSTEDAAQAEAPRRSSRLASQPQPEAVAPKPQRKASAAKKRAAEEPAAESKEAESSKKAKGDAEGAAAEESAEPAAAAALAPINIGDNLPSLVLKNEKGEDIQIADLAKERGVIFFLVPKADTAGCTTQACAFRDIYPDFSNTSFEVYCLSADSPAAQSKWQTKKELPYALISDPKRVLIAALGASEGGKTKRSHFIFEKGGKLVEKQIPVKPGESAQLALDFVKTLQGES